MNDVDDSVSYQRKPFSLRPLRDCIRAIFLNSRGIRLSKSYEKLGKIEDLEDSIILHHEALLLCPSDNSQRASCLNNLANRLETRYKALGKMEDLDFHRVALNFFSGPGNRRHGPCLQNLANSLSIRYKALGNIQDLEESILLTRKALSLSPRGDRHRAVFLNNLSQSLSTLYQASKNPAHLEESASFLREALTLIPPRDPRRVVVLNSLSNSLSIRYMVSGEIQDLEVSIVANREALTHSPLASSQRRAISLSNLAQRLYIRYARLGQIADLKEANSLHRTVLSLRPPGHPERSASLTSLAKVLIDLHLCLGDARDLEEAIHLFQQAAADATSLMQYRLNAAVSWAYAGRRFQHESTLSAYATSLDLLNRSLISRSTVESQQNFLATANTAKSLASEAASAAIDAGKLELAVEFLEQGRAMLWSRINGYKYPFQQLREVEGGAELADRLQTLGDALEHFALLSNRPETLDTGTSAEVIFADTQIKKHRVLSEEWESLVARIRKIEGFSHFLKAPPFDTVRSAAAEGPVILVNTSKYRSDAIILIKDSPPVLVNLPDVRPSELHAQKKLESARNIIIMLGYLWDNVVSPIVDRLAELGIPKKSRIWWCPTAELCALPLHAAGRGKRNLQDMYISSYISTLSSLIKARSNIVSPSSVPKLLVIGEPSTDLELKEVKDEVDTIKTLAPEDSVSVLFGPDAQSHAVIEGLKDHSWAHFACHGHLGDGNQPFRASFELHDRRLPLLDLMQARLPNAELAFLSACHSAQGDSDTPDESIHLSAALQFCGFRSVIGTLWEMDDEDGPMISELFYKYMFRNPEKIDFRDSASALNMAVRKMKKAGVPLDRLALFVHNGA